jgi:hypothetical protein
MLKTKVSKPSIQANDSQTVDFGDAATYFQMNNIGTQTVMVSLNEDPDATMTLNPGDTLCLNGTDVQVTTLLITNPGLGIANVEVLYSVGSSSPLGLAIAQDKAKCRSEINESLKRLHRAEAEMICNHLR